MPTTPVTPKARILVERPGAYSLLLQTAFNQICDPQDWKGPIDCVVPWEAASVYIEAIKYMTATTPVSHVEQMDGQLYAHLTSVGYRMGPAGDH